MRSAVTSGLDALALVLVAVGVGVMVGESVGIGPGLIVSGLLILAGSAVSYYLQDVARRRDGTP